jgi:hypothetical protein
MTTYLTDFFVTAFNEEFDMHESDGDLKEYWGYFCRAGTAEDECPDWYVMFVRDWVDEILANYDGFSKLGENLQEAIKRDIDYHHILTCIQKAHEDWYVAPESEKEEEEAEEETE